MKIFVADNYAKMSKQAAHDVIDMMQSRKDPLICTASGDSPAGLYKEIAEMSQQQTIKYFQLVFCRIG